MKQSIFIHKSEILRSIFFIFIISFISCENFENSPYSDIKFEKIASMPDGGRSSAVSFVLDGKAYVALGRNSELLNSCYQYNPQNDKWKEVAPFPGKARVNSFAETIGNEAYVGLGYNSEIKVYNEGGTLRDLWKYNPKTNSWKQLADFPVESTNKCISFTYDNKIFIGFGFSVFGFEKDLWMYDPQTDIWIELSQETVSPRAGAVSCSNSEYMYFGTGYDTHSLNDWWQYNPQNNSWKKLKNIPGTGRITAVAFSLNERIFVATGMRFKGDLTGGHAKDDLLEYDAKKNAWYHRGTIPGGGRENAISFVIDGKAYVGLGENANGVLDDIWVIKDIN